jgi:CheY-like chemotaxis protein
MAKVLLVEDDPMVSRLYERVLTAGGHEVMLAMDGDEGITMAFSDKPDLILLDIMMPKKNGMEVLEELKKDNQTKEIPVIVLTNLIGDANAEEAMGKGAERYIEKVAYEPKQIQDIVGQVLASHGKT